MSWINEVMSATSEAESPRSFIRWAAYAAISAVVRKKVFLDKFYYKLYPNIYVMLKADSGGRKGFPIWLAEYLIQATNVTKFISGRNSIQAIIRDLSKEYSTPSGVVLKDATAFIVSGEFSELIIDNDAALTILTSLYDTHSRERWVNTLKSADKPEVLENVCLTILGASNETLLMKVVPEHAIQGGFLGRMLMIPDDGSGIINPLTEPPKNKFDPSLLVGYLEILSKLEGEFHYTQDGKKYYEEWYKEHRKKKTEDRTGAFNRMHDQILKVAMILSLSEGTSLLLTEDILIEAVKEVQFFTANLKILAEGNTKSEIGTQIKMVLHALLNAKDHRLKRQRLINRFYDYGIDNQTMGRIQDHLLAADAIETEINVGGDTWYVLKEWFIDRYKKGKEEE